MSKVILSDSAQDPLRFYMKKARQVVTGGEFSVISMAGEELLQIERLSGGVNTTSGGLPQETMTIKISPASSVSNSHFEDIMASSLRIGVDYFDHYMTKEKIELPSKERVEQFSSFNPTYNFSNKFNYYAKKFEDVSSVQGELALPPIFSGVTMDNFIDPANSPFNKEGSNLSNIFYPHNKDINSNKILNSFPFYNQVGFSTKMHNEFIKFAESVGFIDSLLAGYVGSLDAPAQGQFNIQFGTTTTENAEVPIFDVLGWLQSTSNDTINSYYPFIKLYNLEPAMMKMNKKNLLLGFIKQMTTTMFRTYSDILEGKESKVEDVFYSFDKWRQIVVGDRLQRFFLPADSEELILNDTQVKYNNKYIYQCDAHFLIIGNRYRYDSFQINYDSNGNPYYLVEVTNQPSVVMAPLRMFEQELNVLQPPPLVPQVKFKTEMNSMKEIDIYLSTTTGMIRGTFEALFERDRDQLDRLMINSNFEDVVFKDEALDESALFEVYYTDKPPMTYSDLTKKTEIRSNIKSTDALYTTSIVANRKVYYMFRKVNDRGLVSNPTPIYEVELVLDADDAKIVVDTYSFPEYPTEQSSRKFQSLFQIQPAIQHTTFDNNQTFLADKSSLNGTIENITLGVAEQAVWGKKFKFRFKSTTSGKILDFNVTFTLTKNKSKEDF
jgi:hypothetical protein